MLRRFVVGLSLVVVLAAIVTASVWVGYRGTTETVDPDHFNWELAALVLTGLGTTALALATALLALSTWQDVRAAQRTAEAATKQIEIGTEANYLFREAQFQQMRPAVIGTVTGQGGPNVLNVELHNVGGGPAVRLKVHAVWVREHVQAMPSDESELPVLLGQSSFPIALGIHGDPPPGGVSIDDFRIAGTYLDRLGQPAGRILDWRQEPLETTSAD